MRDEAKKLKTDFVAMAHIGSRSFVLADPANEDAWAIPGAVYRGFRDGTILGLAVRTLTTDQLRSVAKVMKEDLVLHLKPSQLARAR